MTPNEYVKSQLIAYPSLYKNRFEVMASLVSHGEWENGEIKNPMAEEYNELQELTKKRLEELHQNVKESENSICPEHYLDAQASLRNYEFTIENIEIFSERYAFGVFDNYKVYDQAWSNWSSFFQDWGGAIKYS